MAKIGNLSKAIKEISLIRRKKRTIVLTGGCFDLLHIGHIKFLQEAKRLGNFLVVLLESDEKVKELKGRERPLFSQKERAEVLSALTIVDYVIILPETKSDKDYEELISQIRPHIIAVTENDPILTKKRKQAEMVKGKLKVIPYLKTLSSSKLARLLEVE